MTIRQRLETRSLEIEERLATLAAEDIGDENREVVRSEVDALVAERGDIATRLRALTAIEGPPADPGAGRRADDPPPVVRGEHAQLVDRSRLSTFVRAASRGEQIPANTPEHELLDADGVTLSEGVVIPHRLMVDDPALRRADVATTSTVQDGPLGQFPWGDVIYNTRVTEMLGISRFAVDYGRRETVLLSTGATASMVAEGAARDSTAAAFTVQAMDPHRLQARFTLTDEAMLSAGPMLESSLRRNLQAAIADRLEEQLLVGDGSGANLGGFLDDSSGLTVVPDPTSVVNFSTGANLSADLVDGRHASRSRDVAVALPVGVQILLARTYPANTAGTTLYDATAAGDILERRSRDVRVSAHLPNTAAIRTGLARRGMDPLAAVLAIWGGGLSILRDPYTDASEAKTHLTARLYVDFAIPRPQAFARVPVKVS